MSLEDQNNNKTAPIFIKTQFYKSYLIGGM